MRLSFLIWWLSVALACNEALTSPAGHLGLAPLTQYRKRFWRPMSYEQISVHKPKEPQPTELERGAVSGKTVWRRVVPTGGAATVQSEQVNIGGLSKATERNTLRSHLLHLTGIADGLLPLRKRTTPFAHVRASRDEPENAVGQEAPAVEKEAVPHRRRRGLHALGSAVTRPFTSAGRTAVRMAVSINRIFQGIIGRGLRRTTSSHTFAETAPKALEVGRGYRFVARAVACAPPIAQQRGILDRAMLATQDLLMDAVLPRGRTLEFESIRDGKPVLLRRGPAVGSGGIGTLFSFTSVNGMRYAGKIFPVQGTLKAVEQYIQAHLAILDYLPEQEDVWEASNRLQVVLPLDIVRKRNEGLTMQVPLRDPILNAILLAPLFPVDLLWLSSNLPPQRSEHRAVLLSLTQQVVRSVSNLHALGIVHLDIKPSNFLVNAHGQVFLTDLDGIRPMGFRGQPYAFTASYVSPELAKNLLLARNAYLTQAMDAWQVGVSTYKIWCKELPFPDSFLPVGAQGILAKVAEFTDTTLTLNPKCTVNMPEEVLDLILQFLKVDPATRLTPGQAVARHPAMLLHVHDDEEAQGKVETVPPSGPTAGFAKSATVVSDWFTGIPQGVHSSAVLGA